MPVHVVPCSQPGCGAAADHKVAAPWQDGRFRELKTYGFACPSHAGDVLEAARRRRAGLTLPPGETVGEVAGYPLPTS